MVHAPYDSCVPGASVSRIRAGTSTGYTVNDSRCFSRWKWSVSMGGHGSIGVRGSCSCSQRRGMSHRFDHIHNAGHAIKRKRSMLGRTRLHRPKHLMTGGAGCFIITRFDRQIRPQPTLLPTTTVFLFLLPPPPPNPPVVAIFHLLVNSFDSPPTQPSV